MDLNVFPPVYKTQLESQANSDVSDETSQNYQRVEKFKSGKGKKPIVGDWVGVCFLVGFIVGFFVCAGMCVSTGSGGIAFTTWVLCMIFGPILGAILGNIAKGMYNNKIAKIEKSIVHSNHESQKRISSIQRSKDQKVADYLRIFESEAQSQSVRFADSDLAKEVIAWMTDGFSKAIDSADRRPHVEQVHVPFVFNVYKGKITCNLGTFDFELKRCRELRNPIEQTALARAISSAIQLSLMMKYPKDASGTGISLNINFEYTNTYVITKLTYIAANGNYKMVKEW